MSVRGGFVFTEAMVEFAKGTSRPDPKDKYSKAKTIPNFSGILNYTENPVGKIFEITRVYGEGVLNQYEAVILGNSGATKFHISGTIDALIAKGVETKDWWSDGIPNGLSKKEGSTRKPIPFSGADDFEAVETNVDFEMEKGNNDVRFKKLS